MAGMMGLAVDLGWSFFSQRAAQAAADDAALEPYKGATARSSRPAALSRAFTACGGTDRRDVRGNSGVVRSQ